MTRVATLKGLIFVGTAKASAALISVLFSLVATRILGATEAGYFFLGLTLLFVGSAIFRLGFDAKLTRGFGSEGLAENGNSMLSLAVSASLALACGACLAGNIFSVEIASAMFAKPEMAPVIEYVSIALIPLTLLNHLGYAFRGMRRPMMTVFSEKLGYLAISLLGFLLTSYALDVQMTSLHGSILLLGATVLSFVISLAVWLRQPGTKITLQFKIDSVNLASNLNLWIAMLMTLTVAWSGVLIGGRFVSAADVAQLATAQRVAVLVVFVLLVCDMFVAPRYAKLFADGDIAQMRRIARVSTRLMLLVALPLAASLGFFSEQVMALFGPEFSAAGQVLTILLIGQTVNVATGSIGQLLTMTKYEADYRRATLLAAIVTVVLTLALAKTFGIVGIAWASTIGTITQNLAGSFAVRKRFGFFPGF